MTDDVLIDIWVKWVCISDLIEEIHKLDPYIEHMNRTSRLIYNDTHSPTIESVMTARIKQSQLWDRAKDLYVASRDEFMTVDQLKESPDFIRWRNVFENALTNELDDILHKMLDDEKPETND